MVFIVAKIVFMLLNSEGHAFTAGDVWDVIRHGFTLDLSTSLDLLMFPFVIALASLWWDNQKWQSLILRIAYALISTA